MIKRILQGTLIVMVILGLAGGLYLYRLVNRNIDEHFAGTCTDFAMSGSGEDIQIDRARGLAYVSLFDRMGVAQGKPVKPGDILRLDLTQTPPEAVSAIAEGPAVRPHGISPASRGPRPSTKRTPRSSPPRSCVRCTRARASSLTSR